MPEKTFMDIHCMDIHGKNRGRCRVEDFGCARCLFCETGQEERVVKLIRDYGWGRAIFARRVRYIWKKKEWVETDAPLLPGYVFAYLQEREARVDYSSVPHVIKVLTYETGSDRLMGRDLEFADWLWRIDGIVGVIKAVQVGDHVEIADGSLKSMHGTILRLNKRQKKMLVSLDTQSIPMQVWLSYELIQTVDGI